MDGLEAYFANDGKYLGKVGSNTTIRVVNVLDYNKSSNNLDKLHKAVENKSIKYNSIYKTTEQRVDGKLVPTLVEMNLDDMLDQAHIVYGEGAGKDANKYAHAIINREIEFAKLAEKTRNSAYRMDKKGNKLFYSEYDSKVPLLKLIGSYGFDDYLIAGIHMPYNEKAVKAYHETIKSGGKQIDGGVENLNYSKFFNLKSDPQKLQEEIKSVQSIFKSIIDARLNISSDPNPNSEGWRGVNGQFSPRNEIKNVKSDTP